MSEDVHGASEEHGGRTKRDHEGEYVHIYLGRLVSGVPSPLSRQSFVPTDDTSELVNGTARRLIDTFDVKKRAYYGNTSMEAEMSLLMANQAKAGPGKLIYDPFAGTGSMLYVCISKKHLWRF